MGTEPWLVGNETAAVSLGQVYLYCPRKLGQPIQSLSGHHKVVLVKVCWESSVGGLRNLLDPQEDEDNRADLLEYQH